jgi:hypothetical protein
MVSPSSSTSDKLATKERASESRREREDAHTVRESENFADLLPLSHARCRHSAAGCPDRHQRYSCRARARRSSASSWNAAPRRENPSLSRCNSLCRDVCCRTACCSSNALASLDFFPLIHALLPAGLYIGLSYQVAARTTRVMSGTTTRSMWRRRERS